MIIELQRYYPDDGRQYKSPLGHDIAAIERFRVDCVECQYTKIKVQHGEDLQRLVSRHFGGQTYDAMDSPDVSNLLWYEALVVSYRCSQETPYNVVAVGRTLMLYGAEQQPTCLQAMLGPPVEQVE